MPHVGTICIIWMPEKWYTTFLHQQAPNLLIRFLRLFDLLPNSGKSKSGKVEKPILFTTNNATSNIQRVGIGSGWLS